MKAKDQAEITLDSSVEKLVEEYPKAVGWLVERGVICVVCGEPFWGTLGELIRQKNVPDPGSLIRELNEFLSDN